MAMKKDPRKDNFCLRCLNPKATERIREYLVQFGEMKAIELPMDLESNKRQDLVFFTFKEEELVKKALEKKFHAISGDKYEMKVPQDKEVYQQQQYVSGDFRSCNWGNKGSSARHQSGGGENRSWNQGSHSLRGQQWL